MAQKERKTQKGAVLAYFKAGHTLTTAQASRMFGCTRLPARISDFRREGYCFAEDWVKSKTRYGTPTKYKQYKLIIE